MDPGNRGEVSFIYDQDSAKPKDEDYLLGKAVDADFERRGTEGQINAVEYGDYFRSLSLYINHHY